MTEHERNTDSLRRSILFADPEEHCKLETGISQVRREQRCIQRAVLMMIPLALVCAAAFGYGAVLEDNFPYGESRLVATFICGLGLASAVCLATFLMLLVIYRGKLNRLLEECRQLTAKVMDARLGRLGTTTLTRSRSEGGDPGPARPLLPVNSAPEAHPSLAEEWGTGI